MSDSSILLDSTLRPPQSFPVKISNGTLLTVVGLWSCLISVFSTNGNETIFPFSHTSAAEAWKRFDVTRVKIARNSSWPKYASTRSKCSIQCPLREQNQHYLSVRWRYKILYKQFSHMQNNTRLTPFHLANHHFLISSLSEPTEQTCKSTRTPRK